MPLSIFLFHGVFLDQKEIDAEQMDPQQEMTLAHYRQFLEYFLEKDFHFVSPDEILKGLDPAKRHLLFTFDDGYFNNINILPLLKEYKIPALFFVSPNVVRQNKNFWWDVLYRERRKQGASREKIYSEGKWLKTQTHTAIEHYLKGLFGEKSFCPQGDRDRPFSPQELKKFSEEKYVHLGNHTCDHAVLTNYPEEEARFQIAQAQKDIFEMTGLKPNSFSYPNGNYTGKIVRLLKEEGLQLGITCHFGKNRLPIDFEGKQGLTLKRFGFESGNDIVQQSRKMLAFFSASILRQNLKSHLSLMAQRWRRGETWKG